MILIVEDDPNDSFLLTQQLAEFEWENELRVIPNGRDALDFLMQVSPEPYAVFLDLNLPGMNGVQLLEEIRKEPRFHALPVIVMTGSIDPADADKCARLGVFAYSAKPLRIELLRNIIEFGNSRWSYLPRPIDPHLADVAFSMLHHGT
jgi:CheY-like chemotaxis protein